MNVLDSPWSKGFLFIHIVQGLAAETDIALCSLAFIG